MGWFKSKAEKHLDDIIRSLEMNMSNNYKDSAQGNLRELSDAFEQMKTEGLIKGKSVKKYEMILADYQEKMAGYSHKDQKPYWT